MHSCFTISHYNENKSKNNYFSLRNEGLQCIKQYGTISANIQKIFYRIRFSSCSGTRMDSSRTFYRYSDLSVSSQYNGTCQSDHCSLFRWLCRSDLWIPGRHLLYLQRCRKSSSYRHWFIQPSEYALILMPHLISSSA